MFQKAADSIKKIFSAVTSPDLLKLPKAPAKAYEGFESCRSCMSHYKDGLLHVRMCRADQIIEQQTKTNQNGKVRHLRTLSVTGHVPCHIRTKGANKCSTYFRNPNKPLQKRKIL